MGVAQLFVLHKMCIFSNKLRMELFVGLKIIPMYCIHPCIHWLIDKGLEKIGSHELQLDYCSGDGAKI